MQNVGFDFSHDVAHLFVGMWPLPSRGLTALLELRCLAQGFNKAQHKKGSNP